jgi:hypothetical protein
MMARPLACVVRVFVLAACVVVLLPGAAAAQQVGGGVKAGVALGDIPNAAQALEGETGVDTQQRIGFAAGAFAMVRFKNGFAIQPEFLYTQKGVKIAEGGSTAMTIKTDFVDVPLLARYTFGKGVRGYVFAGPSFDFKVSAKAKMGSVLGSDEQDLSEDVKTFEFAVVFGGGVELGPILLEGRWSEGLTNLDAQAMSDSPSVKTRTILFLAGLRF